MRDSHFTLDRGVDVHVYRWLPDGDVPVRAIVQVSHGMAEHAGRYARLAESLTAQGFAVYAGDHRGHGRTAGDSQPRGHFADADGWRTALDDLEAIDKRARDDHPDAPLILLGHSMGSFFAQQVMFERGGSLAGVVVSGSSSGVANPLAPIGRAIARAERWRLGPRATSPLLTKLSFGEFNRGFKPARTEYDWLSRDADEVDKYIADPWCGFEVTTQLWIDLLDALPGLADRANLSRIPKDLPVYVVAGGRDPVTGNLKGLYRLVDDWNSIGLRNITWKVYEQARHEVFNETNRDEVVRDLTRWFNRVLSERAPSA